MQHNQNDLRESESAWPGCSFGFCPLQPGSPLGRNARDIAGERTTIVDFRKRNDGDGLNLRRVFIEQTLPRPSRSIRLRSPALASLTIKSGRRFPSKRLECRRCRLAEGLNFAVRQCNAGRAASAIGSPGAAALRRHPWQIGQRALQRGIRSPSSSRIDRCWSFRSHIRQGPYRWPSSKRSEARRPHP